MFERPHHRRVAAVLQALDGERLCAHRCLFGGGTAIALACGEYRESLDIDFLVSSIAGYRSLRQLLGGAAGIGAITRPGQTLTQARDMRIDQYGIRTLVLVDGVAVKFEVVLEARIELEPPAAADLICGVATLSALDRLTTKLLANSDRWRDDSVQSRDLIDLAMMNSPKQLLRRALAKASLAYGHSVEADLAKAVRDLRERPHRLDLCMQALGMTGVLSVPKAVLWTRIKALLRAAGSTQQLG